MKPMDKDFYLYGSIVSENEDSWFGPASETDVTPKDLQDAIDELSPGDTLNLYVNSPGGEVFAASAMTAMLTRAKSNGITVEAYVDGYAASAASFLIMAADTIHIYSNSMLMVHKPLTFAIGNANDLVDTAAQLEEIENATMMPLYRGKLKGDEEELKAMIAGETWMGADKIDETFDVVRETETKAVAACAGLDRYAAIYKHMPSRDETKEVPKEIDYSEYENRLAEI